MKKATIYTFSIVRSSTEAFAARTPYCAAILEAADGVRFAVMLEGYQDGDTVKVGQTVKGIGTDGQGKERYSL